jgi:hypothetical protein
LNTRFIRPVFSRGAGARRELDFVWILRDFTLNLVDEYGNPITEQEYLENTQPSRSGARGH